MKAETTAQRDRWGPFKEWLAPKIERTISFLMVLALTIVFIYLIRKLQGAL